MEASFHLENGTSPCPGFCHRFQNEYLATLRQKHAHCAQKQGILKDAIQTGDVVIVHDKDQPRREWKLGLVQSLMHGSDGLARAAIIKTNSGV